MQRGRSGLLTFGKEGLDDQDFLNPVRIGALVLAVWAVQTPEKGPAGDPQSALLVPFASVSWLPSFEDIRKPRPD